MMPGAVVIEVLIPNLGAGGVHTDAFQLKNQAARCHRIRYSLK
jgi:hypothetical protein